LATRNPRADHRSIQEGSSGTGAAANADPQRAVSFVWRAQSLVLPIALLALKVCYGLKMTPGFVAGNRHVGFRPRMQRLTATKQSACRGGLPASLEVTAVGFGLTKEPLKSSTRTGMAKVTGILILSLPAGSGCWPARSQSRSMSRASAQRWT